MCLSGIAIKLPEGEYDTEPEEKVRFTTDYKCYSKKVFFSTYI